MKIILCNFEIILFFWFFLATTVNVLYYHRPTRYFVVNLFITLEKWQVSLFQINIFLLHHNMFPGKENISWFIFVVVLYVNDIIFLFFYFEFLSINILTLAASKSSNQKFCCKKLKKTFQQALWRFLSILITVSKMTH